MDDFKCFRRNEMDTHRLGIHLVTPKALQILNFSGPRLTWVSISLHEKHSKFSLFCDACMLCNFVTVTQDIITPLKKIENQYKNDRISWRLLLYEATLILLS